jgi:hypothetical protein
MTEKELIDRSRLIQYIIHIYELANERYLNFPSALHWADMQDAMYWYQQAKQDLDSDQGDKRNAALHAFTFREIHTWMDNHLHGTSIGKKR